MTQPDAPDAAIVRRVLGGDAEAFAVLVDRYHDRCLRLATHIVGDADEAEDAVQEAFVRAYRHLAAYREQDRFAAWLLRILVNQCRTTAARRRRRAELLAAEAWQLWGDGEPGEDHPAERDAQREELARALAQLGPEQREAVVLRYADDLTYEEMAAVTGVGVSALKMRVQRAVQRLRTLLTEGSHV